MQDPDHIQNYGLLCDLLRKYKSSSEGDAEWIIHQMQDIDGYFEWLEWMEKNRPSELP